MLLTLGLLEDLFQQIDVAGKGFLAGGGQRASGERTIVCVRLADRNVAGLLQGADVRGEIAVRHIQRVAQLGEREFGRGCEHGHDCQPAFLVNHTIELEKWFGVHDSFPRFSVK